SQVEGAATIRLTAPSILSLSRTDAASGNRGEGLRVSAGSACALAGRGSAMEAPGPASTEAAFTFMASVSGRRPRAAMRLPCMWGYGCPYFDLDACRIPRQ